MTLPETAYRAFLQDRIPQGLLRKLHPRGQGHAAIIHRNGRRLLNFASNDYLGLSRHPLLLERAMAWTRDWGVGATASRLVCGELELFEQVESRLRLGKGSEAALVLGSGFIANATLLPALLDRQVLGSDPLVYSDRLNHASLHHGCLAAGVRQVRYRHNDLNHLEALLRRDAEAHAPRFILTESVFSMDGDQVELSALLDLKERYGAFLYLDEAHATGVLGPGGFGLSAAHPGRVDLAMGTFSKGLGGYGAYVAGSVTLREYLVNRCGGLIYATALPPGVLGAMDAALELLPSLEEHRQRLHANGVRVRTAWRDAGVDTGTSTTQIIPALLGREARALEAARQLEETGILAVAIRPPTVPQGSSRVRFSLSAAHDDEAIAALIQAAPLLTPTPAGTYRAD